MLTRRSFLECLTAAAATTVLPFPALARMAGPSLLTESRLMMGTFVTIKISGTSETHAAEAMGRAFEHMAGLEDILTRFDSASPLGQLNIAGSLRDVPDALMTVTRAAARIHGTTSGAFDPTILALLEVLEQGDSGKIDPQDIAEASSLTGMSHLEISEKGLHFTREGMKMSLDGIAKGFIADEGARMLRAAGVENFLINAGGDIVAHGSKEGTPWRVAVENPEKYQGKTAYPAVCALHNQAMATSGSYEKFLDEKKTLNHILDPATGRCTTLPSASVVAPTAMEADALATALCVLPNPIAFAENLPQAACLIALPEGKIRRSSRWS